MTYTNIDIALNDLLVRTKAMTDYKLANLTRATEYLGNFQDQLKYIHVGGTNGKGSTTDYLRSILQTQGYKVGSFTSPHLISHHDRFRIDDVPISSERLLGLINWSLPLWDMFELSMFEIDVIIAIQYFIEEKVDVVVLEVGLGGRLDGTNIIHESLASVITNIGHDHMQILGNTLEEIAVEKAGIFKPKGLIFTGETRPQLINIFEEMAKRPVYRPLAETNVQIDECITYRYRNETVTLNTLALYQIKNSKLAFEVAYQLDQQNVLPISMDSILRGLKNTIWAGRFEKMGDNIFIDGAHNYEGVEQLVETLKHFQTPVTIVFSALKDKEYDKMMGLLETVTQDIIVTEFDFYRAGTMEQLASGYPVTMIKDYKEAIEEGIRRAKGILVITGSLYFISDVREYLKERK